MKAVIMAGGKGTRLRPLTCAIPKPLVPLLGKPVMAYGLELLKRHGIRDIAVTLQYLPDAIRNYFEDGTAYGVNLHYFEEETPLGTAGSVKNAEAFLDETFVVVSGDALTDFDLEPAIRFHRERGAVATIVLAHVDNPLEYGVVITDDDGRIRRFLEKPGWGEVFSDKVNTGIYILEPRIFSFYEPNREFDFSKDLFPLLMARGEPLYGYVAKGYWSDIGNLAQYRQAQFDLLDGKVNLSLPGREIAPGVRAESGAVIEDGATVVGPAFLGRDVRVQCGARIDGYTVVGCGSILKAGASVKRGILWDGVVVEGGAELRGTTLCSRVHVGKQAALFEGSVVGERTDIGEKATVQAGVKVWPAKRVETGAAVVTSVIWGEGAGRRLFGRYGVCGLANVAITPDVAGRVAQSLGSTLSVGATVAVSDDGNPFAGVIKQAVAAGLHGSGVHTLDLGAVATPAARHAARTLDVSAGVHVRHETAKNQEWIRLLFFDGRGVPFDKGRERKIENAYDQEDFRRVLPAEIGTGRVVPGQTAAYVEALVEAVDAAVIRRRRFRVCLQHDARLHATVQALMTALGVEAISLSPTEPLATVAKVTAASGADMGAVLDPAGEALVLVCDDGRMVEPAQLEALRVMSHLAARVGQHIALPVTAPSALDELAQRLKGQVVRTQANPAALMGACANLPFQPLFDAFYTLARLLEFLAVRDVSLAALCAQLPNVGIVRVEVDCRWTEKGKVMRRLIEETAGERVELLDGVKVYHEDGWTLVLPDAEEPVVHIVAEAPDAERADARIRAYVTRIHQYQER